MRLSNLKASSVVHDVQILFGGTRILQHTGADKDARIRTPDNGCLAVVLRTGFDTSQGVSPRCAICRRQMNSADAVQSGHGLMGPLGIYARLARVEACWHVCCIHQTNGRASCRAADADHPALNGAGDCQQLGDGHVHTVSAVLCDPGVRLRPVPRAAGLFLPHPQTSTDCIFRPKTAAGSADFWKSDIVHAVMGF